MVEGRVEIQQGDARRLFNAHRDTSGPIRDCQVRSYIQGRALKLDRNNAARESCAGERRAENLAPAARTYKAYVTNTAQSHVSGASYQKFTVPRADYSWRSDS